MEELRGGNGGEAESSQGEGLDLLDIMLLNIL